MKRPKPRDKRQELERCPQKGGIVTRVYTMSPKKPNSAIRKACVARSSSSVSGNFGHVWLRDRVRKR